MDVNQIARMIEWLDEERRRDKAVIATLEERITQQTETINNLQRRVNSVESDQSIIRETGSGSVTNEQGLLDKLRGEMRSMLENVEARRLTAEREQERRSELNRETLQRSIRDLTEKFDRINKNMTQITELRSETGRVSDLIIVLEQQVGDLSKKFDEPDRRLAFLEEQRRQDTRRISEVETEMPELRKNIDGMRPKMQLLEDLSIRNERRIQEMQNNEQDRREQLQQFLDSQNLVIQQVNQEMSNLFNKFREYEEQMNSNNERFEMWSQAYRDMKRIIDDFDRIGERLERRINEVAEMQRLSEERFREEWNGWRDDEQRRWKQLTLSNDEVWRNHDKEFEHYVRRMNDVETRVPSVEDSLSRLWNLERQRAALYRDRYQALLLEFDTSGTTTDTNNSNADDFSSDSGFGDNFSSLNGLNS